MGDAASAMTMSQRIATVAAHLVPPASSPVSRIQQKSDDDIVITLAIRTPITVARKGAMKQMTLDGLTLRLLQQVLAKSNIDPILVEEITLGNVRDGKAAYHCRAAALAAGFPPSTAASSVARFCSSGLTAVQSIVNKIRAQDIDIGIAVGAECISEGNERLSRPFVDEILCSNQDAADCMQPMGQTSENVSHDFGITRQLQDEYAVESYRRAETAQKSGWFDDEIVPIAVKDDQGRFKTISADEIRYGTTLETMTKLKPSFPEHGDTTHPGNASKLTDGAAAVLLMKRSRANELGQPILGKYVAASTAGVPPRVMGIAPALAIPKLLAKTGLTLDDVDVVEVNEAFASMAVYCRDNIPGLTWAKLNPRGGAIAFGHPFGMTGIRQIICGLSECRRRGKKILVTSMCMGTGMGMAALFVNEA